MSETYCVWWFETDRFTGTVVRCYRDFTSERAARTFFDPEKHSGVGETGGLSWHHSHSSLHISKANAGEIE